MTHYEEIRSAVFSWGVSQDSGRSLVTFSGELDIIAAPTMRQVLLHPDVANASKVVVDLTEASFLDSTALGIIVAACRMVKAQDGHVFGVTCPDGIVRRVLEISGLIAYLQVKEGE